MLLSSEENEETEVVPAEGQGHVATGKPISDEYASSAAMSPTPMPSTFAGKIC